MCRKCLVYRFSLSFSSEFLFYQSLFNRKLKERVSTLCSKTVGPKKAHGLQEACEYALLSNGKRLRPVSILMIAEGMGKGFDVMPAALSIEFFHTASLILDDLPCMDNAEERRGRPALHKVYGDAVVILASHVLSSAGFALLRENTHLLREKVPMEHAFLVLDKALQKVPFCTGFEGAAGGQYMDLFGTDGSSEEVLLGIQYKTVRAFELAFSLGWLFGGGSLEQLSTVEDLASHFGVAFQIMDDLKDAEQDGTRSHLNVVNVLGIQQAHKLFYQEMEKTSARLQQLNLHKTPIRDLCSLLLQEVAVF